MKEINNTESPESKKQEIDIEETDWDTNFSNKYLEKEETEKKPDKKSEEDLDGDSEKDFCKESKETKRYYDDNGKLYRQGSDLKADNEYEINGYQYKTDDKGRIISAEGKLQKKDHEDRLTIKDSMHDIGKGDERKTDDRGHLIGDQFNGSPGLENLVPQDSKINQTDFRNFENQLAKEVKDDKDVRVKVEPIYESDSRRPDYICVTYSIDGKENVRIFPNESEKEKKS